LKAARVAFVALLAGASAIGFAPILVRWSELPPIATAAWRLLLAQPMLWLWLALELRQAEAPTRPATRRDHVLLALSGFLFAGDMAFWNWSVTLTSVSNAALFPNLAPVLVTLGACVLFGERITARFILGMVLAMGGAALLLKVDIQLSHRHLLGDLCGLATAVFYAAYMLTVKQLRRTFSTATVMAWSGLTNTATLLLAAGLAGERLWPASPRAWEVLLALAFFAQVAGQGLIAYAFAHLSASFSSLSLLFQPIVATGLAWVLLREQPTLPQALGGAVILLGIALASQFSFPFVCLSRRGGWTKVSKK
jgi:drug/metabolite transporter (DMT)-like permease